MGLRIVTDGAGKVSAVLAADGSPLPARPAYRIALNSYDAQFGRRPLSAARPARRRSSHTAGRSILGQIRDALIDFFVTRRSVGRASLLV